MYSAALQYAATVIAQEGMIELAARLAAEPGSLHAALGDGDRARLLDVLLYRGSFFGLDESMRRWSKFSRRIRDRPNPILREEYEQGLMGRDLLGDAVTPFTPAGRCALDPQLAAADQTFLLATVEISAPVRRTDPWQPQGWWWYRVPPTVGPSLAEGLAHFAPDAWHAILQSRVAHLASPPE